MISQVTHDTVDFVWSCLADQIETGLSCGQGDETSSEHMREAVRRGDMQMWVVHENGEIKAGIVLSVLENLNGKKVWIDLLAGADMDSWAAEMNQTLKDFRDIVGAMCVEASCRPGLARYLKNWGWDRKAVIMSLERDT